MRVAMKHVKWSVVVGAALALSFAGPISARGESDDDLHLRVPLQALGSSGIVGTAVIDVGEDGLSGRMHVDNLIAGHAYTVWLFYGEGANVAPPGRFDSTVAKDDDVTFRGHVGGLQVSPGATVTLVIFDHPNLGPTNVTRAMNLLTPNGGSGVAAAVFNIP